MAAGLSLRYDEEAMTRFEILTIFPDFFTGFFVHGVVSRAQKRGLVEIGIGCE